MQYNFYNSDEIMYSFMWKIQIISLRIVHIGDKNYVALCISVSGKFYFHGRTNNKPWYEIRFDVILYVFIRPVNCFSNRVPYGYGTNIIGRCSFQCVYFSLRFSTSFFMYTAYVTLKTHYYIELPFLYNVQRYKTLKLYTLFA